MRLLKEVRNLMANYHVKSGIYHYYRNEFKQAVEFFRKALRDEPNLTDSDRRISRYYLTQTFMNSAEKLLKKGDLEGAAQEYARGAEVSPEWPDIRYHLGKVLERLERYGEAIDQYSQAIAVHETYLDARVAMAFALLRAGRDDEAERLYRDIAPLITFMMSSLDTFICYGKRITARRLGIAEVIDRAPCQHPSSFGLSMMERFLGPLPTL